MGLFTSIIVQPVVLSTSTVIQLVGLLISKGSHPVGLSYSFIEQLVGLSKIITVMPLDLYQYWEVHSPFCRCSECCSYIDRYDQAMWFCSISLNEIKAPVSMIAEDTVERRRDASSTCPLLRLTS